ncbi:hypothetical protein ACE04B_03820 [Rhizobium phaseoli]
MMENEGRRGCGPTKGAGNRPERPEKGTTMSIEFERAHAPEARGFEVALDAELAKRIQSLQEPPHIDSECYAPTRACFVEATSWGLLGVAIWIATRFYFG